MSDASEVWRDFDRDGFEEVQRKLAQGLYGLTKAKLAENWLKLKLSEKETVAAKSDEEWRTAQLKFQEQSARALAGIAAAATRRPSREARAALVISLAGVIANALVPSGPWAWMLVVVAGVAAYFVWKWTEMDE